MFRTKTLSNVLSNATAYNREHGRIDVTLTTPGDEVQLRVTDTGLGIAESDLPKLFTRFFRADPARTDNGGVGLGLAISQEILRAHGGRVEVQSELNVGSTITIRIPNGIKA